MQWIAGCGPRRTVPVACAAHLVLPLLADEDRLSQALFYAQARSTRNAGHRSGYHAASQTQTNRSNPAVASRLPSGRSATPYTAWPWFRIPSFSPAATSHRHVVLPQSPVAGICPSGVKARPRYPCGDPRESAAARLSGPPTGARHTPLPNHCRPRPTDGRPGHRRPAHCGHRPSRASASTHPFARLTSPSARGGPSLGPD